MYCAGIHIAGQSQHLRRQVGIMPFPYKRVLVVGATSGIGEALAAKLVAEGSSVIVVGRRKDKLEEFVLQHGNDKATAVPFDITQMDKIPQFVTKYAGISKA